MYDSNYCQYSFIANGFLYRFAWGMAGIFLGTYSVVQNLNIPLILQPQLFGVLSFVSWAQVRANSDSLPLE